MSGRDFIIYILENHLEDELLFENGKFIGFITVEEAAVKFNVGVETIKVYASLGYLKAVIVDNALYIPANAKLQKGF